MITTMPSRQFNHDTGAAKKAARLGPVIITDRGKPSHVLLRIEDYRALTGENLSLVDLLALPGSADIDFDPARLHGPLSRPADLS